VRVERGIYRLARFPQSDEEQLVIDTLWSRNRTGEGEPEGVYFHQTALSIQNSHAATGLIVWAIFRDGDGMQS
jgi:hypothetical protein